MASKSTFLLGLLVLIVALHHTCSQKTNFVNVEEKLGDYDEPEWFFENVPFVELPEEGQAIEDVYYYRWTSLKRHLRYTVPGAGFIVTEFVHKVGYSQKFDTINAAAGHHIDETRWLRNSRYVKDYINVWSREGAGNQQYSEWIADASWNAYLLNGDAAFIQSQQEGFVNNFRGWDRNFESDLDLYFLSPHDDAMEQSVSSGTEDPYHGGLGYRPSFNSEMYANAVAISKIARMNGDLVTATEFEQKANAIRAGILSLLWDNERNFFYHVWREDNPSLDLLDTREEIGFFPWRWGVPTQDPKYQAAWEELFNPSGFNTEYGPTTCEVRSPWYDGNQTNQCCWWNGNSWPYSTGHTLRALAAQIKHYQPTTVTAEDFFFMLNKYARTQYKNGVPYIAECHSPWREIWTCDSRNHSEHYAHSTYNDNVLSDLIGIEPQPDDTFQVNPLIPSTWNYFIAENIAYHGHFITVMWDRDGSKYNSGSGMHIFVNGELIESQANVGLMKVNIPPPVPDSSYPSARQRRENYAANVKASGYPMPSASFSSATDSSVWQAVDGRIFYDFIPSNRWSNYGNNIGSTDFFTVDLGPGRVRTLDQVKLYVYSDYVHDEGGVDCPTYVEVQYFNTTLQAWFAVPSQVPSPSTCVPNNVWTIDFQPTSAQQFRILFSNNQGQGTFVGISEIEMWGLWPQTPLEGVYEAEDGYLGGMDIKAEGSASGGSFVGRMESEVDDNTWVEFTGVWSDTARNSSVTIGYTNGGTIPARMRLTVNNVYEMEVEFPPTSTGWGEFDPGQDVVVLVPLSRGNNVLILRPGSENSVELDRIRVQ